MPLYPSYLALIESGELDERIEKLKKLLSPCGLCPRQCRANRAEGEKGYCGADYRPVISSHNLHFGEERPLTGGMRPRGSGTIFLAHCNLLCVYCQNFEVSYLGEGSAVSESRLACMMLDLQDAGACNINLVTPTHYTPQIVSAVRTAAGKGLRLPLVYNCGGYERVEIVRLLDGVVDIYMPDMKYADEEPARRFSCAPDYFDRCREAVTEMHRQVGDLVLDESLTARRGLLIRHLVLPNGLAGSEKILRFIAEEISPASYVNVMSQYRPAGMARDYPDLDRHPTRTEYDDAVAEARRLGLTRGLE
ncbi:MAG: radical SAM protein [Spirochaetes bacterium]|nr:radical SAM protein [Spirochaetota bacterium]